MVKRIVAATFAAVMFCTSVNDAFAVPFQPGDFISYSQFSWGEVTEPGGPTLVAHYDAVYASTLGELEVGIPGVAGHSIIFTGIISLLDYVPSTGPAGQLTADLVDPLSSVSGVFGGEVTALHLNIDFADAGHTVGTLGIPFGDLVVHSYSALPQVNGLTIREILGQADTLLGGGTVGYGIAEANLLAFGINNAFNNGEPNQFAQDHLRIAAQQVPEPAVLALFGAGLVGLAVIRRRRKAV